MQTLIFSPAAIRLLTLLLLVMLSDYLAVILAILTDLRSGTLRARRQGLPLTSRGFRNTIDKMLRYLMSLFALSVVDSVVVAAAMLLRASQVCSLPIFPFFTTLGAIGLTLIEAKSVMENTRLNQQCKSAARSLADLLDDDLARIAQRIKSLK